MTFYQELQLNQAGSKNLLKKSETLKEKLYHMWVYLVKIAVTMAFCFFFVSIFSILFGNENSIVGVVVLLCLMVFRNADLGIHTGQSTMLLALFFVIMTVCPHLANQFSPVLGMLLNIAALAVLILFGCHNPFMFNQSTLGLGPRAMWAGVLRAMSVILPFMEDMHYRVRKRIVGNIAGCYMFYSIIFSAPLRSIYAYIGNSWWNR